MRKVLASYVQFLPRPVILIAIVYASGILVFTLYRLLFVLVNYSDQSEIPSGVLAAAMWMGFRFDTVVSGYLLAPALAALSIAESFGRPSRLFLRFLAVYLGVVYLIAFFICTADIPYFAHFNTRLTIDALAWADTPSLIFGVMGAKATEYYYVVAFFLATSAAWLWAANRWTKRYFRLERRRVLSTLPVTLLAVGLLFLGIRGRITGKSPIRWGTAFFSEYAFANLTGLNPAFTFSQSWLEQRKGTGLENVLEEGEALRTAQSSLAGVPGASQYGSPIARLVDPRTAPLRANVVVVLMESMAACRLAALGGREGLTPNLDTLWTHSIAFSNFYSAGVHTYNGVYSTIFGFPGLGWQHPMKTTSAMQPMTGLGHTLASLGYQTAFFTTHDEQYDNMGGFLTANGFQKIISQKAYPSDQVLSTLGVPDHYLFDYACTQLDGMNAQGSPFLAVILTGSNHTPYILPENIPFRPRHTDLVNQLVEYADWSIGRFLQTASRKPWFGNTIFVFVADHGINTSGPYDIVLTLNHIPMIIYAPKLLPQPQVRENLAGQIDVFPTILGLLREKYVNNTLGVDALRESRPYMYFQDDDKIAAVSQDMLWVWRKNGPQSLYRFRTGDIKDYLPNRQGLADSMKTFTFSMLQTAKWLLNNHKAGAEPQP